MSRHTAKSHKIRKVEILVIQIGIFGSDEIEVMINMLHIDDPVPIFFAKK